MYQFEKMNKKLLGKQIEDELMNFILQEPVNIGGKIPNEFELAERFGVGRSTIREAVKGLVSKGILEVRRGSGTYVINTRSLEEDPLGLAKFEDKYKLTLELFEVRLMLAPEITGLAAIHANSEEKKQLGILCDEMEVLYQEGKNSLKKDVEFHTLIARCSKNRVAETLIPIINTAAITFGNLTNPQVIRENIDMHRAITNAILKGDSIGAKYSMATHLTYNRQYLMEIQEESLKAEK